MEDLLGNFLILCGAGWITLALFLGMLASLTPSRKEEIKFEDRPTTLQVFLMLMILLITGKVLYRHAAFEEWWHFGAVIGVAGLALFLAGNLNKIGGKDENR